MQNDDITEYRIDFDRIIETGDSYILAQDIAVLVKTNGLMTVGKILQSIEDSALKKMIRHIEETYDAAEPSEDTCHEELLLITLMMIQAEGGQIGTNPDIAISAMSKTLSFIMLESLYRKGLTEIIHENLSFDEACGNRLVAKATQLGLNFVKNGKEDE